MTRTHQDGIRSVAGQAWRYVGRCAAAVLAASVLMMPLPCSANEPTREDRIKAAILYKISKFVDWPETAFVGPEAPLRVCQFGEDGFSLALANIAGRSAQGRTIAFQVVTRPLTQRLRGCHILYVPKTSASGAREVVHALHGYPVLTISDIPDFAQDGGMVALVRVGDRLSFEIAPGTARDAGIRVHAQLLDLADIVGNGR